MKYVIAYIALILGVNLSFSYLPMLETPIGFVSMAAVLVGFVFVLRDYAQRAVGHYVLLAMVLGVIISYLLANPFVAIASATAFALSETIDWLVYTITKKPFHERVLISSVFAIPIDSFVFLWMIDAHTWGTVLLMISAKLAASLYIYFTHKNN
jgi:uncharacterized PurR-regulated membrane protein YhhQ (DUF165 family)